MSDTNATTDPQISQLNVGIRKVRTIKVYPVSVHDQAELTELITKTMKRFFEAGGKEGLMGNEVKMKVKKTKKLSKKSTKKMEDKNLIFAEFLIDLIKENMGRIIELVSDENIDLLKEMTNNQLADFAWMIYEMNYQTAKKKLIGLFQEIRSIPTEAEM